MLAAVGIVGRRRARCRTCGWVPVLRPLQLCEVRHSNNNHSCIDQHCVSEGKCVSATSRISMRSPTVAPRCIKGSAKKLHQHGRGRSTGHPLTNTIKPSQHLRRPWTLHPLVLSRENGQTRPARGVLGVVRQMHCVCVHVNGNATVSLLLCNAVLLHAVGTTSRETQHFVEIIMQLYRHVSIRSVINLPAATVPVACRCHRYRSKYPRTVIGLDRPPN